MKVRYHVQKNGYIREDLTTVNPQEIKVYQREYAARRLLKKLGHGYSIVKSITHEGMTEFDEGYGSAGGMLLYSDVIQMNNIRKSVKQRIKELVDDPKTNDPDFLEQLSKIIGHREPFHITGKAKVKESSVYIYKGMELEIKSLYACFDGERYFRLSLEGTRWYPDREDTVLREDEFEWIEAKYELAKDQ